MLLALIFLLAWYGVSGAAARSAQQVGLPTSLDGWHALQTVRWLMLVTIAAALALAILQGTQRAPALPVSFAVIATVLGALTSLALIYRVLISVPQGLDQRAGAYLGAARARWRSPTGRSARCARRIRPTRRATRRSRR